MRFKIEERFEITGRGTAVVIAETTELPVDRALRAKIIRPDASELNAQAFKELLLRRDPKPSEREAFVLQGVAKAEVPDGSSIEFEAASNDKNGEAPVRVVPYDPSWPARFEQEREALEALLAPWLAGPIEHIGSTAVPGLAAKPVIDIMAPVRSLEASRPAIPALVALSYCYFPYRPDRMHWFCKPSPTSRTHHLHLIPFGGKLWGERLAFRDALRRDRRLAEEYAELKRRLAEQFEFDREAYTDAKEPFVRKVVGGG